MQTVRKHQGYLRVSWDRLMHKHGSGWNKQLSLAFTVIVEGVFLLYCPTPAGSVDSQTKQSDLKHSGSFGTTHAEDRYYFLPH